MEILFSWTSLIIIGHIIVIVGVTLRVIMMRLAVGTALAWIFLIFFLPFAGAAMYLVLGEKRLGRKRTHRAASLWERYRRWLRELSRQAPGDRLEIMDAADPILHAIIADIDRARHFCHLEFYIWNAGGTVAGTSAEIHRGFSGGRSGCLAQKTGNRALQREPCPVVQSAALIRYKGEPPCWKVF